uniref:Zasp-like motif domain-containing protein n=1 Tax=Syphacia muris TaxID=451379 RepID=A0A0N5AVS3_9BILA
MEEQLLKPVEAKRFVEHSEDEISQPAQAETVDTPSLHSQRAQIAYYRPFVADPMEETNIPQPERQTVSYHDISELIDPAQQPQYSTLERPTEKRVEVMYCRPGFDNVPSY